MLQWSAGEIIIMMISHCNSVLMSLGEVRAWGGVRERHKVKQRTNVKEREREIEREGVKVRERTRI